MDDMKTCTLCGGTKPFEEFTKHRQMKDGLSYWCKTCNNARTKAFRESPSGIYTSIVGRQNFRKTHPERKRSQSPINISREDFIKWYETTPKLCAYCGLSHDDIHRINDTHNNKVNRLTIDRINNDVGYEWDNLVLACHRCNGIKSDLFTHEVMMEIGQRYIKPIWEERLETSTRDTE